MSHPFKLYEVEVLKVLLKDEFSEGELVQILVGASAAEVEYTNYGFYVSIQHPAIGKPRRVYSGPISFSARSGDQIAGFVVFLEHDTLTLETFPWDGEALSASFRDSAIHLTLENGRIVR